MYKFKIDFKQVLKDKKKVAVIGCIVLLVPVTIFATIFIPLTSSSKNKNSSEVKMQKLIENKLKAQEKKSTSSSLKENSLADINSVHISPKPSPSSDPEKTTKIKLIQELEDTLNKLDNSIAQARIIKINNIKDRFKMGDKQMKNISLELNNGTKLIDLLIAYDVVNENLGTEDDLKNVLESRKSGKEWGEIINDYSKSQKKYIPRKYDEEVIKELIQNQGFSIDDLKIADRISQKGFKSFDDLLALKKQGDLWKDIKGSLGIIDGNETYPKIQLNVSDLEKYKKSTGLSEETVKNILMLAKTNDKNFEDAFKVAQTIKDKNELKAVFLKEKYSK